MKLFILCFALVGFLTQCSFDAGKKVVSRSIKSPLERILFVGNSYTYRNKGVDQHVAELTKAVGDSSFYYTRAAKGKYHLYSHWEDSDTKEKCDGKIWDKVVLQEYSSGPIREPKEFMEYGKKWAKHVRSINPKVELFLYATWGYRGTKGMTDSLYNRYKELGDHVGATVVPVGLMWQSIGDKINLYDGDGAHPNRKGTFITACLFYEFIQKKNVIKTPHTDPFLSIELQKELKQLAHEFKIEYERNQLISSTSSVL